MKQVAGVLPLLVILLVGCKSETDLRARDSKVIVASPGNGQQGLTRVSRGKAFVPAQALLNAETQLVQDAIKDIETTKKLKRHQITRAEIQRHPWIIEAGLHDGKYAMQLETALTATAKHTAPPTDGFTKLSADSDDPVLEYSVFNMLTQLGDDSIKTLREYLRDDQLVVADMRYSVPKQGSAALGKKLKPEDYIVSEQTIGPNLKSILDSQISKANAMARTVEILKKYRAEFYGNGKGELMIVILDGFSAPHRVSGRNFNVYKEPARQIKEAAVLQKRGGGTRMPVPIEIVVAVPAEAVGKKD